MSIFIEQIKENAPDGATHYRLRRNGEVFYLRVRFSIFEKKEIVEGYKHRFGWVGLDQSDVCRISMYMHKL